MSGVSGLGAIDYGALAQRLSTTQEAAKPEGSFKLPEAAASKTSKPSSSETIDNALRDLSESQNLADKMVLDLASGRDLNMHNTMVALEQADIALKYTVQLRNRALSAYEELMRIQV